MKNRYGIVKMVYAAVCLALALVLPLLTGQIPKIGNMLCPMHLPVLLCGFLCGWPYGLAVGSIAPILRSLLFGMPPLFPTATAMAAELAAYGAVTGLLYRRLPEKPVYTYVSLVSAMLIGRLVWGGVMFFLTGIGKASFSFAAFAAGAVTNALPGIAVQLILIPILVLSLRKAKLIKD